MLTFRFSVVCGVLALAATVFAAPYKVVTLERPTPGAKDRFGAAMGVVGQFIIVGAPGAENGQGVVYFYDARTGELVRTLRRAGSAADDNFGASVLGVGNRVVIGAPGANRRIGAAYVYDLLVDGDPGTALARSGGSLGEEYGGALGSSLGNFLVAAPRFRLNPAIDRAGIVYHFDRNSFLPTFSLSRPAPNQQVEFGYALAGIGGVIAVGAPFDNKFGRNSGAVYLFAATNGQFLTTVSQPSPSIGDRFGLAVGTVGGNLLVGSPRDGVDRNGEVYLFDPANSAVPLRTFAKPTPTRGDEFGNAVTSIGTNVLIGARGDDDQATDSGAAFLFAPDGSLVHAFANPSPARDDHFGWALASVGRNVAISAPDDNEVGSDAGRAYLFVDLSPDDPVAVDPCNDNDVCTFDIGTVATDCSHQQLPDCCNQAAECSDGDLCNDLDACVNHECVGQDPGCSDGIVCTLDCSPAVGCIIPQAPPGFAGLACWLGALRDKLQAELPTVRRPFAARLATLSATTYTKAASAGSSSVRDARKSLKRVQRRIGRMTRIITRAQKKNRLQGALAEQLLVYARNARGTLPALRASLH